MIVAAGLGTRLRPLTHLRPKPVVPVRGIPMIAWPLRLLAAHGVCEVIVNAHAQSDRLLDAARAECPPGMRLHLSHEPVLLGTGGGIRKAAAFLRESDPCVILGGDMLLDCDLGGLVRRHRERAADITMLLREDSRAAGFGTIGFDDEGHVRRIGTRFDLGGETRAGVYVWANIVSPRAFEHLPREDVFGHLDGWIAPWIAAGARGVRAELAAPSDCTWEPVGTPREYLHANLFPPHVSFLDADAEAVHRGVTLRDGLVLGTGATLGCDAHLTRAVVWDGERVPDGFVGHDGVFAGGAFHPCHGDEEDAGT